MIKRYGPIWIPDDAVPLSPAVRIVRQIRATHAAFTPVANAFRFYSDGTEDGSSPLAAQNTNITVNVDGGDQKVHLRYRVDETGGASGATTDDYNIRRDPPGAEGFGGITSASTYIKIDTASSLTDGSDTTNRATNGISDPGTGSFVAGEQVENIFGTASDRQLTANNFTEHVWALVVIAADVNNGDVIDFDMTLNAGAPGMTNNVTPRITIQKTQTLTKTVNIAAVLLKQSIVKTIVIDTILAKQNIIPLNIDAVLRADNVSKSINISAYILPDITLASSPNISAGGVDSTTAQLIPPTGKSSVTDFTIGKIQDDINPTQIIDIANDDYTELEWSIHVAPHITQGTVFEFRVTKSGIAFDNYSTIPVLVISEFTKTKTVGITAVLLKKVSTSLDINAVLQKQNILKTISISAVLQKTKTDTITINAVLQKTVTKSITIDAVLQKTIGTIIVIDAVLKKTIINTVLINAVLQKSVSKPVDISAVLLSQETLLLIVSAVLQKTKVKTIAIDAVLQKTQIQLLSIDAVLQKTYSTSITIGAVLQKTFTSFVNINAVLLATKVKSITIDAVLLKTNIIQTVDISAVLTTLQAKTVTIDAVLLKNNILQNVNIDAIIQQQNILSTVNISAVLLKTVEATITINAVLQKTISSNVIITAVLQKTEEKTVIINAVLNKTFIKTVDISAVLITYQCAVPDSDTHNTGGWIAVPGPAFYAMIDEEQADDNDYIRSPVTPYSDSAIKFTLSPIGVPIPGVVSIKIRIKKV